MLEYRSTANRVLACYACNMRRNEEFLKANRQRKSVSDKLVSKPPQPASGKLGAMDHPYRGPRTWPPGHTFY